MRDTLMLEIAELEAQKANYSEQLSQTDERTAKHDAIKAELDKTEAKLTAKREALAEIDGAAQIAQEELIGQFDNIEVAGLPFSLRDLAKGPDEYSIISAYFQKYVGDMAEQHATVLSSYKSQVERLEDEAQELAALRKLNYELSDKLADMELRRDAAADELLQAEEEKKRLAADNESLRKQIESTTKTLHTNINTNAAEIAKKLHDAKPAIYNKRWKDDLKRISYIANLAETGEEITIPLLEIGKYRELSEEDAARFRQELEAREREAEAEAAKLAEAAVQNTSLVVPPSLPSASEVPAESLLGAMAESKDEVIRRLERLEKAVFGQGQVA
jgi:chromosome segregation ATPase